jgi:hypothetical protein
MIAWTTGTIPKINGYELDASLPRHRTDHDAPARAVFSAAARRNTAAEEPFHLLIRLIFEPSSPRPAMSPFCPNGNA